jgi:hypothetical protein
MTVLCLTITNWAELYENNRTRGMKRLAWVPMPIQHDGSGYCELLDHDDGMAHFAAWCLIVQVAARCPRRGVLLTDHGRPYSARSLAVRTRGDQSTFEAAIPRLLAIGWLRETEVDPQEADAHEPIMDAADLTPLLRAGAAGLHSDAEQWRGLVEECGVQAVVAVVRSVRTRGDTAYARVVRSELDAQAAAARKAEAAQTASQRDAVQQAKDVEARARRDRDRAHAQRRGPILAAAIHRLGIAPPPDTGIRSAGRAVAAVLGGTFTPVHVARAEAWLTEQDVAGLREALDEEGAA